MTSNCYDRNVSEQVSSAVKRVEYPYKEVNTIPMTVTDENEIKDENE
jgi:hypothetical protein